MLGNLFKREPKWRHRNEQVRRKAIGELADSDPAALRQVIETDPASDLRCLAVTQTRDSDYLVTLLTATAPPEVALHTAVRERLFTLLQEERDAAAKALLERLAQSGEQELIERLARSAGEANLREAASAWVAEEQTLEQIALHDPSAAVRLAALQRVQGVESLSRIHKAVRKRDKQAGRIAKQRLDALAETAQRPQRIAAEAAEIIAQLPSLGLGQRWQQDDAKLGYLQQRWQQLEEEAHSLIADQQRQTYHQAVKRYQEAAASYHQRQAEQAAADAANAALTHTCEAILARLQPLAEALASSGAAADEAQVEVLRQQLLAIRQAWEEEIELPAEQIPAALQQRYDRQCQQLGEQLALQLERREAAVIAAEMCQRLASQLSDGTTRNEQRLQSALQRIRGKIGEAPKGESREALLTRFAELEQQVEQRCRQQRQRRKQLLNEIPGWLEQLEQAVEAGSSGDASTLQGKIQEGLRQFSLAGEEQERIKPLQQRLRTLQPALEQIQEWRDWAVVNERERLCVEMEQLLELVIDPPLLAEQIKELQQSWKHLDTTRAPASKALWERFKSASDRAYQPVRDFRQQQQQQRERHALERQEYIDQLSARLDAIDWSHVDWKEIQRLEREARQQWRDLGEVVHADWRRLSSAFSEQLQRLEERIAPERKRCRNRRLELIESAERLVEISEIEPAIEQARELQGEWQVTVSGNKRDENALWKRFRNAIDATFARRQEAREAHHRALEENLHAKQRLLEQCRSELASATTPEALIQLEQQVESQWSELGALPKAASAELEQQHKALRGAIAQARQEQQRQQRNAELAQLLQLAARCSELERIASGGGQLAEEEMATWQALEQELLSLPHGEPLVQRYQQAMAALHADPTARQALTAQLVANAETKRQLCLHLEILTAAATPPAHQAARMALQVSRLNEAMRQGKSEPEQEYAALQRDWIFTGFAGSEEEVLQQRWQQAQAAGEAL